MRPAERMPELAEDEGEGRGRGSLERQHRVGGQAGEQRPGSLVAEPRGQPAHRAQAASPKRARASGWRGTRRRAQEVRGQILPGGDARAEQPP